MPAEGFYRVTGGDLLAAPQGVATNFPSMRNLVESQKALRELLGQRVLVLDGAMGTMLQQRNWRGVTRCWCGRGRMWCWRFTGNIWRQARTLLRRIRLEARRWCWESTDFRTKRT